MSSLVPTAPTRAHCAHPVPTATTSCILRSPRAHCAHHVPIEPTSCRLHPLQYPELMHHMQKVNLHTMSNGFTRHLHCLTSPRPNEQSQLLVIASIDRRQHVYILIPVNTGVCLYIRKDKTNEKKILGDEYYCGRIVATKYEEKKY